jgi:hypothetical protein
MEEAGKDPISGKFKKGNKLGRGRFAGSKSSAQLAIEQIGFYNAIEVFNKVLEQALVGNCLISQRMILDRVYPIPKARTFAVCDGMQAVHTQKDIDDAMNEVLCRAMSSGVDQISLEEAESLTSLLIKKKETIDECLHDEVIEMQKKIGMI